MEMNTLDECRKEIDAVDREMAYLFERRMAAAEKIAHYKSERALPVEDKHREAQLLKNRCTLIKNDDLREYYTSFLKDVMKVSKDYQSRIVNGVKVVYSGVPGAFGYIAAKKMFPGASLCSCESFEKAYKAVEDGIYDCAVLPIENSYAGDVGAVMDLIFSGSLYINRVFELDVTHDLLGIKGAKLHDIKKVVSHPQALSQCDSYINEHGFESESFSNTAVAAEYINKLGDKSIAAIASCEAADIYGLEIIDKGINTVKSNTTRFAVFTRARSLPSPTDKNGNEHFILVFTTKNEAGALAQTLNIIGAHGYNMRNLRSRPMKDLLWSYYFYIEAEGNISTQNGEECLSELSAVCARLKLAGTYTL